VTGRAAETAVPADLEASANRLDDLIGSYGSVIVAFSGGVDSALVAVTAVRVLGRRALCVTAESPSYPARHRQLAVDLARRFDLPHEFISTAELEMAEYRSNPVNRCYFCKTELYSTLSVVAAARGFAVVADGSNADDRGDYRPGRQAAREHGVRSPLDETGLTKAAIRTLARHAGMPTWDEPASACLSSRIPYHSAITDEALRMIERAEDGIRNLGVRICRVRHYDHTARLELGAEELSRAEDPEWREKLLGAVRRAGYVSVTIDPRGYRMGSLNEGIPLRAV
jgi:uncharacterized protein